MCACGTESYCSRECQRADWTRHKPVCSAAPVKAAAKETPKGPAPAEPAKPTPVTPTPAETNKTKPSAETKTKTSAETKTKPSAESKTKPSAETKTRTSTETNATPAEDKTAWSRGMSAAERGEWLVDCYRMRVDDDYVWGGGKLHGLYDPDSTPLDILKDFLIFAKLAVANGVLPSPWDWDHCLGAAGRLLLSAFEKSDAQDKYGGENIFAGTVGGPSLRYTAVRVYGFDMMNTGQFGPCDPEPLHKLEGSIMPLSRGDLFKRDDLFASVGGSARWSRLLAAMGQRR